ncbi:hypothetical protein CHARACLAT_024329 [Characodon lateralis]|uniref:Uncharacterized protein n=1 Tax=Characodon lateralis TaxID=208331 RepID=A0ABU7ECJ6_9TELE|nr:hypothetical protein [Characodon lateralis]
MPESLPSYSSLPLQGRPASMSSSPASSVAFPQAEQPPGGLTSRKGLIPGLKLRKSKALAAPTDEPVHPQAEILQPLDACVVERNALLLLERTNKTRICCCVRGV